MNNTSPFVDTGLYNCPGNIVSAVAQSLEGMMPLVVLCCMHLCYVVGLGGPRDMTCYVL